MTKRDWLVGLIGAIGGSVVGGVVFGQADAFSGALYGIIGGAIAMAGYKGVRWWRER